MVKGRLIVLGIDGADWDILRALMAEGFLPNFSAAVSGGSTADLLSTTPPRTAAAWASIFTGVNPGKHGLYDFALIEDGKSRYASSKDLRTPYVWEMMDSDRAIAFNIPCAYPPRPCKDAIVVSGFCTPDPGCPFAQPHSIRDEILALVPDYDFNIAAEAQLVKLGASRDKSKISDALLRGVRQRITVATHLLGKKEWTSAFIVFSETDWVQHYFIHEFWKAGKKSATEVARIYKPIDEFLGKLVRDGHDIIIVSDHGFREVRRTFFMNAYLTSKGLLKFKEGSRRAMMQNAGMTRDKVLAFVPPFLFNIVSRSNFLSGLGRRIFPSKNIRGDVIDHANSKAFLFSTSGGIVINSGNGQSHLDEIVKIVAEAQDEGGRKVVRKVVTREEAYGKGQVPGAADIFALPYDDFEYSSSFSRTLSADIDPAVQISGSHRQEGVFLSTGPNLAAKGVMPPLSVADIAPTVLAYYGYPIPAFMDGKPAAILGSGGPGGPERDSLRHRTLVSIRRVVGRDLRSRKWDGV